jgi:hypothetical protein
MSSFGILSAGGTRFLLIGGLATVMHGVDRTTADVDIMIDLDETIRSEWQQRHGMQVFSLWDTENRRPTVDILLNSPIPFDELWRNAVDMTFRGVTVKVASIAAAMTHDKVSEPPPGRGSFDDAEALRHWSFLQRTPEQRLEWLIEMLEIGYASGAIRPRHPQDVDLAGQGRAGGRSAADGKP